MMRDYDDDVNPIDAALCGSHDPEDSNWDEALTEMEVIACQMQKELSKYFTEEDYPQ